MVWLPHGSDGRPEISFLCQLTDVRARPLGHHHPFNHGFRPRKFDERDGALLSDLALIACNILRGQSGVHSIVSHIHHEFRTFLSTIRGYSEAVLDEMAVDVPHRKYVEVIRRAVDMTSNSVSEYVCFNGRDLSVQMLGLRNLINSMEGTLRQTLGESIALEVQLRPDLGSVEVNRDAIEAGITELATRAKYAMPKGGRLVVAARNVSAEHYVRTHFVRACDYVMLSVTPIGVSRDPFWDPFDMEWILEPFDWGRRLELATLSNHVGIVGGDIRIVSELGCFSTFEIYLPASKRDIFFG
jgi:signal transduction histidine kinase